MLDKQEFKKIREQLEKYDAQRELLIKKSRDLLKASKRLIYSLHRNNPKELSFLLKQVKKEKRLLDNIAKKDKRLFYEGSYSEAVQEYVEAMCYYGFVKNKKIPLIQSLKVNEEDYLMGICDLTGELTRRAVKMTILKQFKLVSEIKEVVEDIYGEFLNFNLRNSNLRKKSDSIKWNLKKLEDISYDINTKIK